MSIKSFVRMPCVAYIAVLIGAPVLAAHLAGCLVSDTAHPGAPIIGDQNEVEAKDGALFHRHDIETGRAENQVVLTGFLLGGRTADLATVHVDEKRDRRVRIYSLGDDTWTQQVDETLGADALFVDVANIGGRDRLIAYATGRLSWFDPDSRSQHELVAITSDYTPPAKGAVAHVDITRDLNDDGRDDLVVPEGHCFWVLTQTADGSFSKPAKIGPRTGIRRSYYAEGYRHRPWVLGRVHEMDYNRDGRRDLVHWSDGHFDVHLQDQHGCFGGVDTTFTTEVAFDSDELLSLAAPEGIRRRRMDKDPEGSLTGRVLHSMTDMNGDGIADLVVFSLEGGSLMGMHYSYEVYYGKADPGARTEFARSPGAVIKSKGIPVMLEHHDVDRDGRVDVLFTKIDVSILEAVEMLVDALLTKSVSVGLGIYRMDGGLYPDRPSTARKIRTTSFGRPGEKAAAWPAILLGDVNGDGRSDLLVQRGRKQLRVYLGVQGEALFSQWPKKLAVNMPNEEYTWLVDLNKDGKQDVLMHHASATEPQWVTVLLAR